MKKNLLVIIFLIFCQACDHGLAPPPPEKIEQGILGTIYYIGNFPDSLREHRLIAAKMNRKFRSMNEILNLILSGSDSIQIYPSITQSPLPLQKVDSINYRFVLQPAVYKYIAVVQTTGAILDSTKWKVVGVYSAKPEIEVKIGQFIENVDITVDYDNLPIQPFE